MSGLQHAQQYWYPVAMTNELSSGQSRHTQLLGTPLLLEGGDTLSASTNDGKPLSVQRAFDHWWVTLSDDPLPLFSINEVAETDRTFVPCGVVRVACSPLRAVENFLDIAHFPFVHTDVLGAEPHTEVYKYDVKIDESKDEVIASNIRF